jgi:GT2 family glycosyltransferase
MISVIVPVHDRLSELKECLTALQSWRTERSELILVDDASTGNVPEISARYGTRYFRMPRQQGPAAARNLGAKHAIGEILVFLDADVVVPANAMGIIREEFEQNPDLAALFGSYDDNPGCADFFSSFKTLLQHHVHQASNSEAVTFWSGCGAIRKKVFEAVGGFNADQYPNPSIEDIECGFRLLRQRHKVRLVKNLQVRHLKKWTLVSLVRTDIFQRAIPWSQLILRTGYLHNDLNLAWESRLSATLVAAVALLAVGLVSTLVRISSWPGAVLATVLALAVTSLLLLNRELYLVFLRKRGAVFVFLAIVAHWAYLFYCGATFVFCLVATLLRASFKPSVANSHLRDDLTVVNDSSVREKEALPRVTGDNNAETCARAGRDVAAAD